jgi:hypothetical protein
MQNMQHDLPQDPVVQLGIIKEALTQETNAEPFLPFPGSVLPALIALRRTQQTIVESREFLSSHKPKAEQLERQLENDRAALKDQTLLNEALETRIASLRDELASEAETRPDDGARKQLKEMKDRKQQYDADTSKLLNAMNGFISGPLSTMLAAEVLGGPVVGDAMDIDAEDLAAGFNTQGKLNKIKAGEGINQDKRQRRIDEIWGRADDNGERQGQDEEEDEVTAAAKEMRQLTEELLNRLADAGMDGSAAYVKLPRESAAARFLVRSKVAQFHPKDATRLRLFDFGRDLED